MISVSDGSKVSCPSCGEETYPPTADIAKSKLVDAPSKPSGFNQSDVQMRVSLKRAGSPSFTSSSTASTVMVGFRLRTSMSTDVTEPKENFGQNRTLPGDP